ncbi:MAG: multiple monosaccharide ABC transporter ATP-binding protein [Lachnospirales bacterium]
MNNYILKMQNITKCFGPVKALSDVNIDVRPKTIHAICGENGAGKSTLMNVLSGIYPHDTFDGEILFEDETCSFKNIKESEKKGIVIIHQELALSPYLSIAENIYMGNEIHKNQVIDWHKTADETKKLLKKVGLNEKTETVVSTLGIGKQQLIEIAKALSKEVKLLILDEPTAALNEEESDKLIELLGELRDHGITSILISHKLNEVCAIADDITILRDGKTIETFSNSTHKNVEDKIVKGMVGREISDRYPKCEKNISNETILEVKNWNVYNPYIPDKKAIDNVNFEVKRGEIVGFAGLMGAGRTELFMSIFGHSYGLNITGEIYKDGKEIKCKTVSDAINNKIVYASEDRKQYGLVLINSIKDNTCLPNLKRISKNSVVNENEAIKLSEEYKETMNIKASSIEQHVGNLSGGNQQKVVLSKWLMSQPDILILDEPTRGIDVGAKYEIYQVINELAKQGKAIILISSELPELLGMSDRIYVLDQGEILGSLDKEEASQEKIMRLIINHKKGDK